MIRPLTLLSIVAAAGAGLHVYNTKHAVSLLDRELRSIARDIQEAETRTQALQAEWAWATEQERLRALAQRHLAALEPMQPAQFLRFAEAERRLPPPVAHDGPATRSEPFGEPAWPATAERAAGSRIALLLPEATPNPAPKTALAAVPTVVASPPPPPPAPADTLAAVARAALAAAAVEAALPPPAPAAPELRPASRNPIVFAARPAEPRPAEARPPEPRPAATETARAAPPRLTAPPPPPAVPRAMAAAPRPAPEAAPAPPRPVAAPTQVAVASVALRPPAMSTQVAPRLPAVSTQIAAAPATPRPSVSTQVAAASPPRATEGAATSLGSFGSALGGAGSALGSARAALPPPVAFGSAGTAFR